MALVLGRDKVLQIYKTASEKGWVLPAFNSENQTTTEAILAATWEYGQSIGKSDLPIIIAVTNNYPHRPQTHYYTHTRNWKLGLQLFMDDLKTLTSQNSPFADLKVMIHLDHIQWDSDQDLLSWDMNQFSSIMFDASELSLDENIQKTAEFVKLNKGKIIIEGACDEIGHAFSESNSLTTPEMAKIFFNETGVDIIVANLGTEHRANAATRRYDDERAREIRKIIGPRLCLHGTSSLSDNQLSNLFKDGICKVNIWTALERDSTSVLFRELVENASKLIGKDNVEDLIQARLLDKNVDRLSSSSVDYFTTSYRQNIVFNAMKEIVIHYLKIWYK